jgi:multiple sugar transport system ATP-binding protein
MRNQLVVALDPSSRVTAGEEAQISLNPRHLHVFDVESGDNLTAAVPAGAT